MPDLTQVTFYLSDEDRMYLTWVRERHPNWSVALIFKRALGFYARNMDQLEPQPKPPLNSATQAITELFGPE